MKVPLLIWDIASGSDLHKIKEQVGDDLIVLSDYTFSENGLFALKKD